MANFSHGSLFNVILWLWLLMMRESLIRRWQKFTWPNHSHGRGRTDYHLFWIMHPTMYLLGCICIIQKRSSNIDKLPTLSTFCHKNLKEKPDIFFFNMFNFSIKYLLRRDSQLCRKTLGQNVAHCSGNRAV